MKTHQNQILVKLINLYKALSEGLPQVLLINKAKNQIQL